MTKIEKNIAEQKSFHCKVVLWKLMSILFQQNV
jgi:hypothetical protein